MLCVFSQCLILIRSCLNLEQLQDDRCRLIRYTLYAIGVPAIVTGITAIVEFLPEW